MYGQVYTLPLSGLEMAKQVMDMEHGLEDKSLLASDVPVVLVLCIRSVVDWFPHWC